jgi:hypothetical protein
MTHDASAHKAAEVSSKAGEPIRPDASGTKRSLVILPAYNESESVAGVVGELARELPEADILVIDDGSTDGTAQLVPPPARVIRLPFNLGIGGAMQTGYRYAQLRGYDEAVQVDADGQHPPSRVRLLLQALRAERADMVVGSRFLEPTGYHQMLTRRVGMGILGALLRALTGQRFTDCTSGFRAVSRRTIRLFSHWYPEDYPEPEVLLLLKRAGLRLVERSTTMNLRQGGQTSIPLLKGLFYVAKVSVALLLDTMRSPWPAALFEPQPEDAPASTAEGTPAAVDQTAQTSAQPSLERSSS